MDGLLKPPYDMNVSDLLVSVPTACLSITENKCSELRLMHSFVQSFHMIWVLIQSALADAFKNVLLLKYWSGMSLLSVTSMSWSFWRDSTSCVMSFQSCMTSYLALGGLIYEKIQIIFKFYKREEDSLWKTISISVCFSNKTNVYDFVRLSKQIIWTASGSFWSLTAHISSWLSLTKKNKKWNK